MSFFFRQKAGEFILLAQRRSQIFDSHHGNKLILFLLTSLLFISEAHYILK